MKCACAEITKTNTELRNKMLKNQESLLLGTRHFLIYDKWPPSLSFDRVKTFYGDPLKMFFLFLHLYIITSKYNHRFEHNFLLIPEKMIHALNNMPLVHSRLKFSLRGYRWNTKNVSMQVTFNEILSKINLGCILL